MDCTIYSGISVTKTECYNTGGGGGSGPSDTFCDDTNCNEFPSPGSGPLLEEEEYKIILEIDTPCIEEQVLKAINNHFKSKITHLIWNAFGQSENFHIQINDEDFGNDLVDGDVFPSVSGGTVTFMVSLNTGALSSASKEYIIATVFHELLHAYMGYLDIDASSNTLDHENMADNYLNLLTNALIEHYNISHTDAMHLSWGGLQETNKWSKLSQSQKNQIIQTNGEFKSGKGSPC